MRLDRALGSAVAGLVAAAGLLVPALATTPAASAAAPCSGRTGVVVVVDFAELGGGVTKGCDSNGGTAANNFQDAGFPLMYAQDSSGFICRISNKPADDPCDSAAQADRYWSLWWSDGKTGTWKYASLGVNALKVPAGGYVAFAWHQGGGRAAPPAVTPTIRKDVAPSPSAPAPSASTKDSAQPGKAPSAATPTPSASNSAESSPSSTASAEATPTEKPSASDTTRAASDASSGVPAIDDVTEGPPPSADTDSDGDASGFPAWVAVLLAVLVLGAAGAVPIIRRRSA